MFLQIFLLGINDDKQIITEKIKYEKLEVENASLQELVNYRKELLNDLKKVTDLIIKCEEYIDKKYDGVK